jgi:hypothetical protein
MGIIFYEVRFVGIGGIKLFNTICSPRGMVLVQPSEPFLPKVADKGNLVMLHHIHANRSGPMIWQKEPGTFYCDTCGERVNFSDNLFRRILEQLSAGKYEVVSDQQTTISIAHLLGEFPEKMEDLDVGHIYVVKREATDSVSV